LHHRRRKVHIGSFVVLMSHAKWYVWTLRSGSKNSSSSVALQPGVGLGLLYNTPSSLSIPCSVSPFVYSHLPQVRGHVIQPPHLWSYSSSCWIQLSVQHPFWDCGVSHSFYMTKPSYYLAFNKPENVLPLNYCF